MHGRPQRGATPTSPGKRLVPPAPRVHRITSLRHGATLIDDFAWLRDRNWQAVMRDPGLLDPAIRHHLEQETPMPTQYWLAPGRYRRPCLAR
jgi:protease II